MDGIQDSLCGKTSPERSSATKAKTSMKSSARSATFDYLNIRAGGEEPESSWEAREALPGVSTTLNFGVCPSVERVSTLSEILEENAPEKYSLSPRACAGILRRAKARGKELPDLLKEVLEEKAHDYGVPD